jgi:plasmid replication initiation protein
LSSVYSQILFRYLHSWKNLDNGEKTTPLGELHELLSTPPSFRKDFKALRKYALEPSYKEITEKTNLDYEWEPIKAGLRKVVAIRFIFNPVAARLKEKKALEGQEARANEETEKIRAEANHCFIEYKNIRQECTPKMRTKRCKYCTGERGLKYNYPELQRKKCDA